MADYMGVKDLNLEQKEKHDRYDTLDRSDIDGPVVEKREGHDRVDSTRQTRVAETNESKRSTDKSMERDYVTLVEKGPEKVQSTVEKRPTCSFIPSSTGKRKEKKKAPRLETADKDEYDSLYQSAIKDLDLERLQGNAYDKVEGWDSTRQKPAVQTNESKRSPDKTMEMDYVTLVEKGPGKVPSIDADSRPTSSLPPRRAGKKTVKKKAPQLETTDKDEYDSPYLSAIEDLNIDRWRKEEHDRVEGPYSTRQTPVPDINELKSSPDKAGVRDNGNLAENGPGKVLPMGADSRPTSSLKSSREDKKKVTKKAAKLETSAQDIVGYDELNRSEAVFSSAQTSIALQPIVKCQKRVEKTWGYEESVKVTNLTFGEEKADFDWEGSQGMESSNVRALEASIVALDRRLSTVWRSVLILSTVNVCAVVIAIVALYIAMASSSGGDYHLQFRSDRTNAAQGTNSKLGECPITSWTQQIPYFVSNVHLIFNLDCLIWFGNASKILYFADFSCKDKGKDFQMCQELQSLRQHIGTLAVFPQHLMKHEENFSHLTNEVQAMRQELATLATFPQVLMKHKEILSDISSELNRTSHTLRAETNAREQELDMLSFQLNSTKADFVQLVETTNRTLNKKRKERLASLETKISSRLKSQEEKVNQLQDQQMHAAANANISALKEVSLFELKLLV